MPTNQNYMCILKIELKNVEIMEKSKTFNEQFLAVKLTLDLEQCLSSKNEILLNSLSLQASIVDQLLLALLGKNESKLNPKNFIGQQII